MIDEMAAGEVESFLKEQFVARIGCHARGRTYVVPVIYAWEDGCAYVYTVAGQKVDMMRANSAVCFEVDEYQAGGGWRSVIIQGTYEELDGEAAERTLALLAERFARPLGAQAVQRPRSEGREPVAFRVRAEEVTGRKVERSPG